jgi:uncharacterized protein
MKFFTTEQLSENRFKTPEGFLVCVGVPIARTGVQLYAPFETPIPPGADGMVRVERTEAEVFRAETIASANGKDICDDHPDDDVLPMNFRQLTQGVMLDPRRGAANEADLLLADFMIKDATTMALIDAGKVEVSLGYDADYVQTGQGTGEQRNIIINHVALVAKGRCGPRCSIGDHGTCKTEIDMKVRDEAKVTVSRSSFRDLLTRAFKAKDAEEVEKLAKEHEESKDAMPEGGGPFSVHVHNTSGGTASGDKGMKDSGMFCTKDAFEEHVAQNEEEHKGFRDGATKMRDDIEELKKAIGSTKDANAGENKEIEGELEEEAPPGTGDEAKTARDSAYLEQSYTDTLAGAEILAPGIIPRKTFDKAAPPVRTYKDGICGLRRDALDLFYNTPEGRAFIDQQLMGRAFNVRDNSTNCRRVTDLFRSSVAMKRQLNNMRQENGSNNGKTAAQMRTDQPSGNFGKTVISAADLAAQASAAWDRK